MRDKWTHISVVVAVALVVGFLVGQSGMMSKGWAQSSSSGGDIAVVIGAEETSSRTPFVLVDSVERRVMVYEWDAGSRSLYFRAARDFTYDRLITNYGNAGSNSPSPQQVQERLQR